MGTRISQGWSRLFLNLRINMGLCPHRFVGSPTFDLSRGNRGVFVVCKDCKKKINYCLVDQDMHKNARRFC